MVDVDSTQYDSIKSRYENVNDLPAHAPLFPTVDSLVESLAGKHVLDLACGSGYWTRILADMGAAEVVGCDISEGMIEDARNTSQQYTNVAYHVADCSKALDGSNGAGKLAGQFDLTFAAWFLNYAGTTEDLVGMWSNIYSSLRPGGCFIGILPNPENQLPLDPRYGTYLTVVERINEGQPDEGELCHMKAFTQPPVEFDCYKLSKKIFEQTAAVASMIDVSWHYPVIPKDGWPEGYWDVYEKQPHFVICMASKADKLKVGSHL